MPRISIIIPTFDHGPLLERAVASVARQTVEDWELFVIGDGVPADVEPTVLAVAASDERITFVPRDKSPRTGEPYRDDVLRNRATGDVVAYLSDDDIWLPDHLQHMLGLLLESDFAHALPTWIDPDGTGGASLVDLSNPAFRAVHLAGSSRIALSFGAHTLDAYRRLERGWETTPAGRYTDWFMWAKFLERDDLRAASGFVPTVIHLGGDVRRHMTLDERAAEMDRWLEATVDDGRRLEFVHAVLAGHGGPRLAARLERQVIELDERLQHLDQLLRDATRGE